MKVLWSLIKSIFETAELWRRKHSVVVLQSKKTLRKRHNFYPPKPWAQKMLSSLNVKHKEITQSIFKNKCVLIPWDRQKTGHSVIKQYKKKRANWRELVQTWLTVKLTWLTSTFFSSLKKRGDIGRDRKQKVCPRSFL